MKLVYLFWALLPVLLIFFTARGAVNAVARSRTKEYVGDYFRQALFCAIGLGIAIYIDRYYFDEWVLALTGDESSPSAMRWITFPLILLVMAGIESKLPKKTPVERPHKHLK